MGPFQGRGGLPVALQRCQHPDLLRVQPVPGKAHGACPNCQVGDPRVEDVDVVPLRSHLPFRA